MRRLLEALTLASLLAVSRAIDCAPDFSKCQPPGAKKTALPAVSKDLAPLYGCLLSSIHGIHAKRAESQHDNLVIRESPSICCASGTACLNLEDFDIPLCYDRFTTNFVLADGTSGTLCTGELDVKGGPRIDMFNGSYQENGGQQNIYNGPPPNTSTLPIPTPYTSSGIGAAIPITQLAGLVTVTQTIVGTTIDPTTLPGTTSAVTLTLSSGTSVIGASLVTSGSATSDQGGNTIVASQPTTVTAQVTHAPATLPGTTVKAQTLTFTTSLSNHEASANEAPVPTGGVAIGVAGLAMAILAL